MSTGNDHIDARALRFAIGFPVLLAALFVVAGLLLIPPTTTARDARVGGAIAKPPPAANMPSALTCTVPIASCTWWERLITAYIAR